MVTMPSTAFSKMARVRLSLSRSAASARWRSLVSSAIATNSFVGLSVES
jgi:hypothetical protein